MEGSEGIKQDLIVVNGKNRWKFTAANRSNKRKAISCSDKSEERNRTS